MTYSTRGELQFRHFRSNTELSVLVGTYGQLNNRKLMIDFGNMMTMLTHDLQNHRVKESYFEELRDFPALVEEQRALIKREHELEDFSAKMKLALPMTEATLVRWGYATEWKLQVCGFIDHFEASVTVRSDRLRKDLDIALRVLGVNASLLIDSKYPETDELYEFVAQAEHTIALFARVKKLSSEDAAEAGGKLLELETNAMLLESNS